MRQTRLRHLAEVNPAVPGWEAIPEDQPLTFLPLEAVWPGRMDYSRQRPKAKVASGYTRFCEGDVIVPKITPTFQADRSTLIRGMPTAVGTGTTELHVVRPSSMIEPRYLDYLMSSRPFLLEGEAWMIGVAGQKRVPDQWIRDFPVPVTDPTEQRAIANYLDTETSHIDILITKKRRMVELLEERQRTVITRALRSTRKHGERRPLRAYADVHLGRQRSPRHNRGPHMTPYLRAANVKDGVLDLSDVKSMNFEPAEQNRFALVKGDVLVSEGSGSLMAVGASAVWNGEIKGTVCFQNTLLRLRPRPSTDPRFLAWWCRYAHTDGLFANIATGANIHHISADRVRSIPMNHVPLVEQNGIVEHLNASTSLIATTLARQQRMLDLLSERRQALISAAVTGELPVSASWG